MSTPTSASRSNPLWQCERKRGVLRRIARDISSLFHPKKERYAGFAGSKSGPFAPKRGLVMLPNGTFVPEGFGKELLRAGDFEFDDAQEAYLHGGAAAIDDDC
jgi:hypothetical protein